MQNRPLNHLRKASLRIALRRLIATILLLPILGLASSATELDALLRQLQRPLPQETEFVERRGSELLREPLVLRGRLAHPDADTLVREVQSPYHERASISAGAVILEREGERTRRFSLRRAPELGMLLEGFRAVLGGSAAGLQTDFEIDLQQHAEGWVLRLLPRAAKLKRRVFALELRGRADELQCLRVEGKQPSEMLVGAAALAEPVDFAAYCGSHRRGK